MPRNFNFYIRINHKKGFKALLLEAYRPNLEESEIYSLDAAISNSKELMKHNPSDEPYIDWNFNKEIK